MIDSNESGIDKISLRIGITTLNSNYINSKFFLYLLNYGKDLIIHLIIFQEYFFIILFHSGITKSVENLFESSNAFIEIL